MSNEKSSSYEPQSPVSVEVGRSQRGIVQNPNVYFFDGRLVVQYPDNNHSSDTTQTEIDYVWRISSDGGDTWQPAAGPPTAIAHEFMHFVPSNDFRHPFTRGHRLADGTLLAVGSYGWENFADTPENRAELMEKGYVVATPDQGFTKGTISVIHRAWMSRSSDNGQTWDTVRDIALPRFFSKLAYYNNTGGGLVLADGAFVQPMWGRMGRAGESDKDVSVVFRTTDGGDQWTVHVVGSSPVFEVNETAITAAPNGDIVALMRSTDWQEPQKIAQRDLWTATSHDGGVTWTDFRRSGLLGSTPWLVTTPDDLLVAVYARRWTKPRSGQFDRTGIYACISRDNGRNWNTDCQVALIDTGQEVVDGYPKAVALPDGTVYAVYVYEGSKVVGGARFDPRHKDFGGLDH